MEHFDQRRLITALADCFSGAADETAILRDCSQTMGRDWKWLKPVASRFVEQTAGRMRPRHREIERFLLDDPMVRRALRRLSGHLRVERRIGQEQRMQPAAAAETWGVPPIPTVGALADWLWIEVTELEWFADSKAITQRSKLGHYTCRVLEKRSGGVRLIESPKPRLKAMQRQILDWILDRIPAHQAAHGFVKGRSIKTFAEPHVGQAAVLRMDLRDFFPAIRRARVQSLFRTAGYPESVADALGGICTTITRSNFSLDREARQLYSMPHLPQGAPTSPALANLCAYRLDCRLTGFAEACGGQYTRYADDLAFSGGEEFARTAERLPAYVGAVLAEEGFPANFRKTRVMRPGVRQHLAGLVVNGRLNIARDEFDRLKAILTNCERFGPARQNREAHPDFRAHLRGRIGYVESIHAGSGQKLRRIFERISWE